MISPRIQIFLWSWLMTFSYRYAMALTAQAVHETGNFTSALFKDLNNPWGMAMPQVRPNYAKPGRIAEGHVKAKYDSLWHAVMDRLELDRWNDVYFTDVQSYMTEVVENGYAADTSYLQKWWNAYRNLKLL